MYILILEALEALDQDISTLQTRLEALSLDDPKWLYFNLIVANRYATFCEETGATSHLNPAIDQFQKILEHTPENHPERFDWHWILGGLYNELYYQTETATHLDRASQHLQECIQRTPDGHPHLRSRIRNTASVYKDKVLEMGRAEDGEICLQLRQKALDLTPQDDPDHPYYVWELGEAYYETYTITKQSDALEKAILLYRRAIEMIPKAADDIESQTHRLRSLANACWLKFDITRALGDLKECIFWREKSIEISKTIPEDASQYAQELYSLARLYQNLYYYTGALSDLDKTIELCKEALRLTDDPLYQSKLLQELGWSYGSRHDSTGAVADSELATKYKGEALVLASDDPSAREMRLASLSGLKWSYDPNTMEDIQPTIRLLQETIAVAPAGHPDSDNYLYKIGKELLLRYTKTGARADLEASIQQLTKLCSSHIESVVFRYKSFSLLHMVY